MNDLISRQAAIEELRDAENHAFNSYYKGLLKAHHIIADLPSIQIEQKPGRWIDAREQCGKFMCSNCQFLCCTNQYNYCPNCGAKMESDNEVKKMPKLPKTPKGWLCSDVMWHVPDKKKPIAYSTFAASSLIVALSRDGCMIKELLYKIRYDTEAKKVIKQYIDKGYGDIIAKTFFS